MMFGYLTLFTALILSMSAAVYSILGLTAIFAAAFWPIVVLGGSLEFGKIVTTLWLHKYWDRAEIQYKVYLCSAVVILMVLTSMGVFGFLSKAHLDQAVPSGDIQAQVQIFDDKIQTQKDNIKTARAALTQMDSAVDQTMGRSQDEKGADKAVAIRRSQARERTALQNDISKAQTEITRLQEQRAPVASQARQVEAEVGPIKYIAALIYGDNPDANILEKAVRWVIILIVVVFDPLALTLLLAATKTFEWERGINILAPGKKEEEQNQEDSTFTTVYDEDEPVFDREIPPVEETEIIPSTPTKKEQVLTGLDSMWNRAKNLVKRDPEAEHAPIEELVIDNGEDTPEKIAERAWKAENPDSTLKRQRQLHRTGLIEELPWQNPEFQARVLEQTKLEPDNVPTGPTGEVRGFGSSFPTNASKGDMFLRVDRLPSGLYKFNGNMWIEVDKALSDSHAWDDAYIDHLIAKIGSGEYDPDLLTNAERDRIESKLKSNPPEA
jgi:hypothetical protein